MRVRTTPAFDARHQAWRKAYAAHAVIASHPDRYTADLSPESLAASDLEYATLEGFLTAPAFTPTEILKKLQVMRERDVGEGWTDHYPRYMAQIERDVMEQQRPCVSPPMSTLFDAWREALRALCEDADGTDECGIVLCNALSKAILALLAAPCHTPGDFILKVYVEMIGEHGGTFWGAEQLHKDPGGYAFEIDDRELTEGLGRNDGAAQETFFSDIDHTDLGSCLMALGRVDFEPGAWLAAADRAGLPVTLIVGEDTKQALWIGMGGTHEDDRQVARQERVQRLLTGNGGGFGSQRSNAVCEHILASEPHRIAYARSAAA